MREFTEQDIRESESTKRIIAERDRYKAAVAQMRNLISDSDQDEIKGSLYRALRRLMDPILEEK